MSEEQQPPQVHCPKCGSTQVYAGKKGFSGKKAVAGAILTGGIGILAGTIGSNKIKITCLNCGNVFSPGDSAAIQPSGKVYSDETAQKKGNSKDVNELLHRKEVRDNFKKAYEVGNKEQAFAILKENDPEASKYTNADEAYKAIKGANQTATVGCIIFIILLGVILYFAFR